MACWGTTPLPQAFNMSLRLIPMDGSLTHPSGSPIIHSVNLGLRR